MAEKKWTEEKFNRRHYNVAGPALDDARRIELIVKIDGKSYVHMQAREPGIVAFVSRPTDGGFDIEIVEATGVRYTDHHHPSGMMTEPLADWQKAALELEEE